MSSQINFVVEINGYNFKVMVGVYGGVALTSCHSTPDYHDALSKAVELWKLAQKYENVLLWEEDEEQARQILSMKDKYSELTYLEALLVDIGYERALITIAAKERRAKEASAKKKANYSGYVYLLKSEVGHWKIGRAKDPVARIKTFTVKLPFRVEYETLIKTDDMQKLERELHERFADKRLDGEWFDLDADDVEYIRGLSNHE